jgi:hypothetical protein
MACELLEKKSFDYMGSFYFWFMYHFIGWKLSTDIREESDYRIQSSKLGHILSLKWKVINNCSRAVGMKEIWINCHLPLMIVFPF